MDIAELARRAGLAYGDRTLIKQVYANLLAIAVKFTKYKNSKEIEAGGYTEGNEDVFYVKDNGVGFNMAYYDKLFGIFQRLHNGPDFEGTGVGLATVQRVISIQGGRVWAEAKEGEGATFYFSLSLVTHTIYCETLFLLKRNQLQVKYFSPQSLSLKRNTMH